MSCGSQAGGSQVKFVTPTAHVSVNLLVVVAAECVGRNINMCVCMPTAARATPLNILAGASVQRARQQPVR